MKSRPENPTEIADAQPTPIPPTSPDCLDGFLAAVSRVGPLSVEVGEPASLRLRNGAIQLFSLGRLIGDDLDPPEGLVSCLDRGVSYAGEIRAIEQGRVMAWVEMTG